MNRVEKIEGQVKELTAQVLARFRAWFAEYDWNVWDGELERDVELGSSTVWLVRRWPTMRLAALRPFEAFCCEQVLGSLLRPTEGRSISGGRGIPAPQGGSITSQSALQEIR